MRNWSYALNPFLLVTDSSYFNAMELGMHHDNALQSAPADTVIAALYKTYHPIYLTFRSSYNDWIAQGGSQQGETLNLSQLIRLLTNTKIQQWDVKIQTIYPINTPQYKKIMTHRRKPFQTGTQTEKLEAVQALSKNIGADAALASVKTEVDAFLVQYEAALTKQQGSKTTTKTLSDKLEPARINLCNALYANLGALMQKYSTTPTMIESYFDQKILRRSKQVFFKGQVKASSLVTVVKHTFVDSDEVYLNNTGTTTLQVYLAASKDLRPTATAYKLTPGERTVAIKTLGNLADTFLIVFNPEVVTKGSYEIEIL